MRKVLNSPEFWGLVTGIILCFLIAHWLDTKAQNVIRKGNVFVCTDSVKQNPHPTMTKYFYLAADGTKYPIYMSASGKCFVIKISKKTGKPYRKNLPEVTKQLYGNSRRNQCISSTDRRCCYNSNNCRICIPILHLVG